MPITFPDDILNLITLELWKARDFNTLFQFAMSSRQFAALGLAKLYRMQDVAPVKPVDEIDAGVMASNYRNRNVMTVLTEQKKTRKWVTLWRSILLSTYERKTILPYSRYIRVLDLNDLDQLLEDLNKFRSLQEELFAGNLKDLHLLNDNGKLLSDKIYIKAAERITQHTPLLEELGGAFQAQLSQWLPRLPRLKTLRLYNGVELDASAKYIRQHCPLFKNLFVLHWGYGVTHETYKTWDTKFSDFLEDLKPASLESLEIMSCAHIQDSVKSLNHHSSSLTSLTLHDLSAKSVEALPEISGVLCLKNIYLKTSMISNSYVYLWQTDLKLSLWLGSILNLQSLKLEGRGFSTTTIFHVLENSEIQLQTLVLMADTDRSLENEFLSVLSKNTSLTELVFDIPIDSSEQLRIEDFTATICCLTNLRKLHLIDCFDSLRKEDHYAISISLRKLEELSVGALHLEDSILKNYSALPNLRSLGLTSDYGGFSFDGVMEFIQNVDEHRGMQLEITGCIESSIQESASLEIAMAAKGGVFIHATGRIIRLMRSKSF
ncbi:hypothetical protein EDC01DRAFT_664723 [Geopyxis carbonaria]|nr:hypothetical protein EDC01DRAFT_664723 [Geopyxis carbonaria]